MDNENITQITISNINFYFEKIKIDFKHIEVAFSKNNLYRLINLSKDFYDDNINFIQTTHSLLKTNQIALSTADAQSISKKVTKVEDYIFQLKNHRNFWLLNHNPFTKKFDLADIYREGNEKLNVLTQEMSCLSRLDTIKNTQKSTRRCL